MCSSVGAKKKYDIHNLKYNINGFLFWVSLLEKFSNSISSFSYPFPFPSLRKFCFSDGPLPNSLLAATYTISPILVCWLEKIKGERVGEKNDNHKFSKFNLCGLTRRCDLLLFYSSILYSREYSAVYFETGTLNCAPNSTSLSAIKQPPTTHIIFLWWWLSEMKQRSDQVETQPLNRTQNNFF